MRTKIINSKINMMNYCAMQMPRWMGLYCAPYVT